MSPLGRALLVAVLAVALAGPLASGARAAETPAEQLHEAAVKAHRAGRLRQAIELWRDALKLEPNWKYAYNLANTLYESDAGLDAWRALARAEELQPPEKYVGLVAELRSKVRALLFKDHAWLVLDVRIAGAVVKRNGVRWEPPWDAWLDDEESTLEVAAAGYVTATRQVRHKRGERTDVAFELEPEHHEQSPQAKGTLRVDGTPPGARVVVAGVERGALPLAPFELAPGSVVVRVSHPGYLDEERTLTVVSGHETPLTVTLKPEPAKVEPNGLATPGWITFVSGLALAGIGTGFYFWSESTANEISDLQGSPDELEALGYEGYRKRYDDLDGAFADRLLASRLLLGLGGAAVVTGITLILLDESPAEGDAAVHVVPVSGGGLVVGGASF